MRDDSVETTPEGIAAWLSQAATRALDEHETVNLQQSDLWSLLDSLPVAILVSPDCSCRYILGNATARRVFGLSPGENFSASAPPDELPPYEIYSGGRRARPDDLPIQIAAKTGVSVTGSECELRFHDGRRVFIAGDTIPIRNRAGEVCGSIGAFLDVTSQKNEVEFSRVVSREMAHRLKNTVAMIQSISRRTVRPLISDDAYRTFEDRLISLATFQDLLSRNDWAGAGIPELVESMISVVARAARHRISASGPFVALPSTDALAVRMLLHELATNACKYGALSGATGKLEITWDSVPCGDRNEVVIEWVELEGPTVVKPETTGFGTTMMNAVARGLSEGCLALRFEPTGLRAKLTFLVAATDLATNSQRTSP